jgi:hypothetical protein
MKLLGAEKEKLFVELTRRDWETIAGVFVMVSASRAPEWTDSTGDADDAVTPEEFKRVCDEWLAITRQPEARPYFVGKPE